MKHLLFLFMICASSILYAAQVPVIKRKNVLPKSIATSLAPDLLHSVHGQYDWYKEETPTCCGFGRKTVRYIGILREKPIKRGYLIGEKN